MEYFKLNEIDNYSSQIGEVYNASNLGPKWYKDTRIKLQHLIHLIGEALNIPLTNNYNEKPNKMAGQGKGFVLKEYILAGFVPSRYSSVGKDVFVKFCFESFEREIPQFSIDIDVNFSDGKNKRKGDREKLQADSKWIIPLDGTFPKDWDSLIEKIKPIVNERVEYLEDYLRGTNVDSNKDLENEKGTKNKGFSTPLNQILFGPPGTGKTYHTLSHALSIIGEVNIKKIYYLETYNDIGMARQRFPEVDLKNAYSSGRELIRAIYKHYYDTGQIVFTTFHQSMSYEDFMEGIKPLRPENKEDNLNYDVQKGIFGDLAFKAQQTKTKKYNIDEDEGELTRALFESFYESFSEKLANTDTTSNCTLKTKTGKPFSLFKNSKGSIMVKPGEDGTFMNISCNELKRVFFDKTKPHYSSYEYIIIDKILEGKNYQEEDINNKQKNFVLIIDEINRGNVSEIFGELITLIEEDKRLGKEEALEVELPYSKEKFAVPSNLYILGTMNTADRSVEALDTALRRRFSFVEMPPKPKLLENDNIGEEVNLKELLIAINDRIEKLLTKDHLIGHSYFMGVDSYEKLKVAFSNKIIPLLQEYFYGDFGKIGMVLGREFVKRKKENVLFADFDYNSGGFDDKDTFEIIEIGAKFNMKKAVDYLLRRAKGEDE